MHLKNFSFLENSLGIFGFSPAYDLLSTALVIPVDNEESALTINGKNSRLKLSDFDALAKSLGINEKSLQSIYTSFGKVMPTWEALIRQSFLIAWMQERYLELLLANASKIV